MVDPRKLIVWIITHSETAKKGEGVQLDMLVFCNRSKHVTDAARRCTTLLRCCIWSSSASPTLTAWAAAAEARD